VREGGEGGGGERGVSIVLSVFVFVMCVDKAWPACLKWNHRSLWAHKLHLLAKRGEGSETIKNPNHLERNDWALWW
jgi:hypothetical protein